MFGRRDLMIGAGAVAALGGLRLSAAHSQTARSRARPGRSISPGCRPRPSSSPSAPTRRRVIRYPDVLETIDYDAYQQIQFRPERALWAEGGAPFPVQFFHLGRYFKAPVRIYVVAGRQRARDPLRGRLLHLRQDRPGQEAAGRPRLCRLSGDGWPGRQDRLAGLSGGRLFPHLRRARSIRPLGPRPRDRHRDALAGGVSRASPSSGSSRPGRQLAHPDLCADGQPERHRRLSLRLGQAGGRRGRHPGRALLPQGDRADGRGAADQHVLVQRDQHLEHRHLDELSLPRAQAVHQGHGDRLAQRHPDELVGHRGRDVLRRAVALGERLARPDAAWMASSYAGFARYGPACPNP